MKPCLTAVACVALTLICVSRASGHVTTYRPFVLPSDGTSELSSTRETFSVETNRVLLVEYSAPASHCSSVKIHFSADGAERLVTPPVAPGASTGYVDLGPVTAGTHIVSVRAEGVPGGCNRGVLQGWGGSVSFRTASNALPAVLGPIVFESSYTNFAWGYVSKGCFIDWNGAAFSWSVHAKAPASGGGPLTEDVLLETYADRGAKPVGHLSDRQLREMRNMIGLAQLAAHGKVAGRQARYDAGELKAVIYIRGSKSPDDPAYTPVTLAADGDDTERNTSSAAAKLLAWFATEAKESGCSGTGQWQ